MKRIIGYVLNLIAMAMGAIGVSAQPAPDGLIDFDSIVPLNLFRSAIVHRSFSDVHLYFAIPNSIGFDTDEKGRPRFGVEHHGITYPDRNGVGANLVVSMKPLFGAAVLDDLQKALLALDPAAKLLVPAPVRSHLSLILNPRYGEDATGPSSNTIESGLAGQLVGSAKLTELGTRVMLSEASEGSDLFGAKFSFALRGVQRNASATEIVERNYSVSLSFAGTCSTNPPSFVDLTRRGTGCLVRPQTTPWWLFGAIRPGTTAYPAGKKKLISASGKDTMGVASSAAYR